MRFAEALAECGALADIVSPRRDKFIYRLTAGHRHIYSHHWPQTSLLGAISKIKPLILVSGDDRVLAELMSLHSRRRNRFGPGDRFVQLIESSLGDLRSYAVLMKRAAFIAEARALGINAPPTMAIPSKKALVEMADDFDFPIILKLDGTSGGAGTVVAYDLSDAASKCRMLLGPWRRIRKKIGASLRGEGSILAGPREWIRPVLNAQAYIRGRSATTAFACWRGKLIGAIHAEVLQEAWPNGPATVLKIISSDQMDANAEKIALRFRLSGVHGLDYVVDQVTGVPWLVEINPRLTQIAHLALGPGRDLAASLLAYTMERPVVSRPVKINSEVVALLPQEWLRDPKSAFLRSAYHDVPPRDSHVFRALFDENQ